MSQAADRLSRFAPLGVRRNLLLDCLGGHTPQAPGFLDLAADANVFAAFRDYIRELSQQGVFQSDPVTALLLAAGRVLIGELDAADVIVAGFPGEAHRLRFGQRYCPLLPFRTLGAVLPLPPNLADTDRWLAGSNEQAELRSWLVEHRTTLNWIETEGNYL